MDGRLARATAPACPPINEWDCATPFQSMAGAALVREAAQAERQGVACLRRIADAL